MATLIVFLVFTPAASADAKAFAPFGSVIASFVIGNVDADLSAMGFCNDGNTNIVQQRSLHSTAAMRTIF
jgi:hypothetical protein